MFLLTKPQLQALLKDHQPARKNLQWIEFSFSEPGPPPLYANLASARRRLAQQLIDNVRRFADHEGVVILGLLEKFHRRNTHAKITTYVFLTRITHGSPRRDHHSFQPPIPVA